MPFDKPKLSVLLPAYNAEKYIRQAIISLLKQTYTNLEILVCDDGSSDKTFEVIKEFADDRIRFFQNIENLGKNITASHLLEQSSGKYISIHDADDISLPSRFERQINFLLQNPEYALCGTNFISFLQNGKIIDRSKLESDSDKIKIAIQHESQFHGPTIVFRKDILAEVGGLYRYFTRAEDIDFTMRVTEKFKTVNLPEHLYLYRHIPSSLTNKLDGYNIERLGHAKLLYFLAKERAKFGEDSLMKGDMQKINSVMNEFVEEYQSDPTIALRRGVFRLLGMRMYRNAVQLSWAAMNRNINILNIKCFIYALLESIRGNLELSLTKEKIDLGFLNLGNPK